MRQPYERRWPQIAAGYTVLLLALTGLTTLLYVSVAEIHKPLVIRLAVAAFVGVVFLHGWTWLRKRMDGLPASAFERALHAETSPPKIDPFFLKLREEVQYSLRSRRYFERVLGPRLCDIAKRSGKPDGLEKPPPSAMFRKGLSPQALALVIDRLERTP